MTQPLTIKCTWCDDLTVSISSMQEERGSQKTEDLCDCTEECPKPWCKFKPDGEVAAFLAPTPVVP